MPPRHGSRPVRQSILRCLMCFEVAGVHHDINSVEGSKVSAFFEYVAEDLRPEGLPRLSICLIRQGCVSLKTCRRVTDHESWQGIEALSSMSVSWQWFIHDLLAPLCMGEPNGRWCDWSLCREPYFIRPKSPRSFIYFHGQGISTRLHVVRLRFSVSRTDTDSSDSIIWKRGRHVSLHQNPPPAEDYSVLSGRTNVRKKWQKPEPAEDYNVLSGVTRSNQESHKELQRPVGTWSQNNKPQGYLDRYKFIHKMQVMKHVTTTGLVNVHH